MIGTELGDMRRSHYSDELDASMGGREVVVMGWVLSVRGHGNLSFLNIRDKNGQVQVVAKRGGCPDDVRERISALKPHSSVGVRGRVTPSEKAPGGVEVLPDELRVFSDVERIAPFDPQARTVKNIDTRLDVRPIDLRRTELQHVFNARSRVLRAVREYLYGGGFVEVNTPKMISSATEGGASLFGIFYYGRQAFLAQSPQLYKEQLTMSFEKVFEIGPIFRAESSRTNRHLSEAVSIDLEEAFVDYGDVMNRIDAVVRASAGAVSAYAAERPGTGFEVPEIPDPIPRHSYADLVGRMRDAGIKIEFGDDLYPADLRKIGLDGFYFIRDWPLGPKPFYVKGSGAASGGGGGGGGGGGETSESFDLMFGDLELSSGSTRIEKRGELTERIKNKGLKIDSFGHHLEAFDYGVPPHAGCGIGLERLMMALTGIENIRDATFYPRDVDRLTP